MLLLQANLIPDKTILNQVKVMDAVNSLKPADEIRMFAPLFYLKQKK